MEYARFGKEFVKRSSAEKAWATATEDELPESFFEDERRRAVRAETGRDPWFEPTTAGTIVGDSKRRVGAIRLENPEIDAIADELGVESEELRTFVTSARPDNTRKRVTEDRWNAIGKKLGLTGGDELSARFRGEQPE